jgi:hypothetical protein
MRYSYWATGVSDLNHARLTDDALATFEQITERLYPGECTLRGGP